MFCHSELDSESFVIVDDMDSKIIRRVSDSGQYYKPASHSVMLLHGIFCNFYKSLQKKEGFEIEYYSAASRKIKRIKS